MIEWQASTPKKREAQSTHAKGRFPILYIDTFLTTLYFMMDALQVVSAIRAARTRGVADSERRHLAAEALSWIEVARLFSPAPVKAGRPLRMSCCLS